MQAVKLKGGRTFAHVDAKLYQPLVLQLQRNRFYAWCDAIIVGGWDRGNGDEGNFGVKLDLAPVDQCCLPASLRPRT